MGSCVSAKDTKVTKKDVFQKAFEVFNKIDKDNKKIIDRSDIQQYFKEYTDSCYQILMRQMDFNVDGKITRNQWLGYWQYIRLSGYTLKRIYQQLCKVQRGEVSLNFPNAKHYQPNQPRETLLNGILSEMKNDQVAIDFLQNLDDGKQ